MSQSGESSKRSNIIDVTYQQLHSFLSGRPEGNTPEQVIEYLNPRLEQIRAIVDPFGKPSDASRKQIESGSVTLRDGVVCQVEDSGRDSVFAISAKFQIDQVQALILLRSFFYNEGLPPNIGADADSMMDELVEAITPFYFSERLHVLRIIIPILRALEEPLDPIHLLATEILPKLLPDPRHFVESLVKEYVNKTHEKLPANLDSDPKTASRWAKQNSKEQLVMLEVLFGAMWSYVSRDGPLLVQIFEAAYSTRLGSIQKNSTLLLDEEGSQLQQDSAALWILITIEVLELETIAEGSDIEISDNPDDKEIYTSSPESLMRIHELITTHGNPQYACTYLAWTFVLSRLVASAKNLREIPNSYRPFFDTILPPHSRDPTHVLMSKTCLSPDAGLFDLILMLLTKSPLFVTAAAFKTGSSVTDPNVMAYRCVLKGLVIALVELVAVELIPDFEKLVEVWIALFGRSESKPIARICSQYWKSDWDHGIARRAIFDVARLRFPIHVKPLIRLLRAMTGAGFLDTDPLSTASHSTEGLGLTEDRHLCDQYVFHFFAKLSTFSQVIPISATTGPHALYERQQERYGSSVTSTGLTYINLRPIKLPGGSTLPARTTGRLLSGDGGEYIVVSWQHEHSGWKVLLEILTDYVNRRRMNSGTDNSYQDISFGRRGGSSKTTMRLEDVGVEVGTSDDEAMITDVLDLIRSLIQDNPSETQVLVEALESGDPVVSHTMTESQPPGLVQLATMILEEALSRSNSRDRHSPKTQLITSAMSVLSALLAIPNHSNRVWLYIRSTTALFGSDSTAGFASVALAAERVTGHYTMTLALLYLVQQLFHEASSTILPSSERLQQVKEEVLLRAARFVHTEIWVEHLGWKYAQLGDRFEIGRRVAALYVEVLRHAPPTLGERPFQTLSQAIADVLLFKPATSTINPLVSSIAVGGQILDVLFSSRRLGDARRLIVMLGTHLRLIRLILTCKQTSSIASKPCLLEQSLCSRVQGGSVSPDSMRSKVDPIDIIATYVNRRDVGAIVPLEAIRVLYALGASLSSLQPSSTTIVGHLSNPEATVTALVRIIRHPYDELPLRNAVWNFMSLAVDKEPALAGLFVIGRFRTPGILKGKAKDKGKEKEKAKGDDGKPKLTSAMDVACEMLSEWRELWELNPQLLTSILRFLDAVWQHALEHKAVLEAIRNDEEFWTRLADIACEEVGPVPEYHTTAYAIIDGVRHSDLHEGVAIHSYRTIVKSYALHIISLDIGMHLQSLAPGVTQQKPLSFRKLEPLFNSEDQLVDLLSEAAPSSYDPQLYDDLVDQLKFLFPALTLEQLRSQDPISEREFGDDFTFSIPLLRSRLNIYRARDASGVTDDVEHRVNSINLNLSLTHSQIALVDSWQLLLRQVVPFVRGNAVIRATVLTITASISGDVSRESRSGDMMATIHGTRLSLLLSLLEVAWFSTTETKQEVEAFVELVHNIHGIILNEPQSPAKSFLGTLTVPFHRTLLQIIYFCIRHCRSLAKRPKALNAEQRLTIAAMVDVTLTLVIDALRIVFISARSRIDLDLDRDMELLVAVFGQSIRTDINPSSILWLTRCQETNVIRASLDLYVHTDLVGLTDLSLLLSRKKPLYAPYLLLFHMALASIPSAAERFASEGVLPAYSNNYISAAISNGGIDVVLPEFPGERSPAHRAYCQMLSIVAGVVTALGRHNHYFDAEASGFIQLYGSQISRALSWTIGEPITLPLLEEIEQVVNLFYALAESAPSVRGANPAVEKVLRDFTTHALLLLQQVNYALTHPNHLASLFEPVTVDERAQAAKASSTVDPLKKPLIARLVHRLFRLSSQIVLTLITISRAHEILVGEQEDWPMHEVLVVPHSKVVLSESTSMGTLLELANCTLDVLRDLVGRPTGQAITLASSLSSSYDKPLDVREGVATARRNLEAILLYAVTQLVMWLSKPEFDMTGDSSTEAAEEYPSMEMSRTDVPKDRRGPRSSMNMADRLRRGMTGEIAADLQSLLAKAKPVVAKSNAVIETDSVDLTQILSSFLQERIATPQ